LAKRERGKGPRYDPFSNERENAIPRSEGRERNREGIEMNKMALVYQKETVLLAPSQSWGTLVRIKGEKKGKSSGRERKTT